MSTTTNKSLIKQGGFIMKRFAILVGSIMLVAMSSYPVLAWGPMWGGGGRADYWQNSRNTDTVNQEQQGKLDQLNQKFYQETAQLRENIWAKKAEMRENLNGPNPDGDKVKGLQKEISDLKTQLAAKRLDVELEARKIAPENTKYAGQYNRGNGNGYGRRGGGYGRGNCWN
jgi:Spy/CpxP family protein refolding chaperone